MRKVVLIGATTNPSRYAYLATHQLVQHHFELTLIGIKKGEVSTLPIHNEKVMVENVDTVTLYIGPNHQEEYYPYILKLQPKRVIFNPGTENEALYSILEKKGIEVVEACTLVMLSTNQF